MPGFRRAQLRGSEELFRPTEAKATAQQEEIEVPVHGVSPEPVHERPAHDRPVPNAPDYTERTLRLHVTDIELLANAVQHLKFPNKTMPRPSMDEFERLEELRKRLLESI
jgi:hypothetical protein